MRAVNPHLAANVAVLDEMYTDLLELLGTLDDYAFNWSPPFAETNSIAVLTAHMLGSNARWLSRATGNEVATHRPTEFQARGSVADAVAKVEQAKADARRWLEQLEQVDLGTTRDTGQQGWTVSAAWCVEHAIAHAHDHWGQVQLTRQLHAAHTGVGTKS
jgi:hypothetical protein